MFYRTLDDAGVFTIPPPLPPSIIRTQVSMGGGVGSDVCWCVTLVDWLSEMFAARAAVADEMLIHFGLRQARGF